MPGLQSPFRRRNYLSSSRCQGEYGGREPRVADAEGCSAEASLKALIFNHFIAPHSYQSLLINLSSFITYIVLRPSIITHSPCFGLFRRRSMTNSLFAPFTRFRPPAKCAHRVPPLQSLGPFCSPHFLGGFLLCLQ